LVLFLAKRNGGIFEPEQRLWVYHLVSVASAAGVIIYGVGASYGVHWIVPCIGLALIGFAMNAAIPIAMGYALDCYNDLSGEIVQLTNFLRNAIAGALTFVIQPWVNHNGARYTSVIIGLLLLAINLTSIVFQVWGKKFRANTAPRYRKLVEKEQYF
jgi:MFS family permease